MNKLVIYRFSKTGFKAIKQTAWLKFIEDLKEIKSLPPTQKVSSWYWDKKLLYYKIRFGQTMLVHFLYSKYIGTRLVNNTSPETEYLEIDPEVKNRGIGSWVFLKKPTKEFMNKHCFTFHAELPLFQAEVSEETMAYEKFGDLATYKSLKEHLQNPYITAVFIPNPTLNNVQKVDKVEAQLNFTFVESFGFVKKNL